ncbi:hypothetical protein A1Q1_03106 [Trichosporon asahii var. asahii CBS 2479]|uniref:Uncharacterized protein n=1 Tax=Trichosporon asahii var. asahii (strain ATCC 90039 / CBS 2479 / JCM 2466 / KCTC 7840 / NBRC 103889/ NCYC 2677 / UAMH 7654) TaxID=1186058 RepID=J6FC16_TRIAS|nr:hypothetical protein A1Q1_03106 [Trichosporon asahii var. asahii CBS 2479]EJT52652.1 hypothetical protein A1Q1_03106 [Trichosporon asahii var. asahii CBS 2479]
MPNSPTCAAASIRLELVEVNITETSSAAPRMGPILRHVFDALQEDNAKLAEAIRTRATRETNLRLLVRIRELGKEHGRKDLQSVIEKTTAGLKELNTCLQQFALEDGIDATNGTVTFRRTVEALGEVEDGVEELKRIAGDALKPMQLPGPTPETPSRHR